MTSEPTNTDFSHFPATVEAWAAGIIRASDIIIVMACSAVVTALPKGVFITTIPARVAAATSMLSTPMPARPITLSEPPSTASMTPEVTLVAERTTRPS